MCGTLGFQYMRSSTSRSPSYRFLQEQRHRLGTDASRLFQNHDLIALSNRTEQREGRFLTPFSRPGLARIQVLH